MQKITLKLECFFIHGIMDELKNYFIYNFTQILKLNKIILYFPIVLDKMEGLSV